MAWCVEQAELLRHVVQHYIVDAWGGIAVDKGVKHGDGAPPYHPILFGRRLLSRVLQSSISMCKRGRHGTYLDFEARGVVSLDEI